VPVPKHKHSKSRRDKRAAHFRVVLRSLSVCPRCRRPKLPHVVCPSCGYYRDRRVVQTGDEDEA
jgi:large subunit ribosomal protein L32